MRKVVIAGSVAESHTIPGKAERAFFRFNILSICGQPVDQDPKCAAGDESHGHLLSGRSLG